MVLLNIMLLDYEFERSKIAHSNVIVVAEILRIFIYQLFDEEVSPERYRKSLASAKHAAQFGRLTDL
jgi:hypothetical protein